jgi:hypothetical protein
MPQNKRPAARARIATAGAIGEELDFGEFGHGGAGFVTVEQFKANAVVSACMNTLSRST